ncbi:MAG: translocation/assembly module TamB domain-containing protein [Chloroherpetonaceae bacterium]|nr:translocation/assembly module TamB domain-containing protein [Chthonomonadaceae bacterium]MDW8208016.1 translocation/assembly module TamB domain-containing protein [Chloroherpetonaceae bacterium]
MRSLRSWVNLLLLLLPLLWLGIGASRLLRDVCSHLLSGQRLAWIVSAEATRQLEREVRIASLHWSGNLREWNAPFRVEARNVQVAEKDLLASGIFATVGEIHIAPVWSRLFSADVRLPLFDRIDLVDPYVLLSRDRQGRWNFESFLKPEKPPGRLLADRITVTRGRLHYRDAAFPHPPGVSRRPVTLRAEGIDGTILIHRDRSVAFQAGARLPGGPARQLFVVGVSAPEQTGTDLGIRAYGLQLSSLAAQFLPRRYGRFTRGTADLELSLHLPAQHAPGTSRVAKAGSAVSNPDYHGRIWFSDVDYRHSRWGVPLQKLTGKVQVTGDTLVGQMHARVAGADVQLQGQLQGLKGLQKPVVSARVAIDRADIARLIHTSGLTQRLSSLSPQLRRHIVLASGQFRAFLDVRGPLSGPEVSLHGRIPLLASGAYRAQDIVLRAHYANGHVDADVRGSYAGGKIAAQARYHRDAGTYRVIGRGRGLSLAALGLPLDEPPDGTGQVDLIAWRNGGKNPRIEAQAEAQQLKFRGQSLDTIYARLSIADRELRLRALRVEDARGFALAHGVVNLDTKQAQLDFGVDELDLGALTRSLRPDPATRGDPSGIAPPERFPLEGIGYLRGQISGTWDNPRLQARLNAFALQAGKLQLDQMLADLSFSREALIISQGAVRRYPGGLRFSGLVVGPLEKDPSVRLTLDVDDLDVRYLLDAAGIDSQKLGLAGTLNAQGISVVGTPGDLRITRPFQIVLEGGVINGLPVERASLSATQTPEGIVLSDGEARLARGIAQLRGNVSFKGDVDLRLDGQGFQLEDAIAALPGLSDAIGGTLNLEGTVTGTIEQPRIEIRFSAPDLQYNRFPVGSLQGIATYSGRQFGLQDVQLQAPPDPGGTASGSITLTRFTFDPEDNSVVGEGRWNNLRIQRLSDLFLATPYASTESALPLRRAVERLSGRMQGALQGTVSLKGNVERPRVVVTWQAENLRADEYEIVSLNGSALLTRESVTIPDPERPRQWLQIELPAGIIEARQVHAEFDGRIEADVSARNVDLGLLQKWVGADPTRPVRGTGDLFLVAGGQTRRPDLTVSVLLNGLEYEGRRIESIELTQAAVTEGRIQADAIRMIATDPVSGQRFVAQASGSVGFSYEPPYVRPDAPLSFVASLEDQDIQAFSSLVNGQLRDSAGRFSARLEVQGTREQPVVTGTLSLDAPRIKLQQFATGLADVRGTLRFEGDRVTVEQGFRARSQIFTGGGPVTNTAGSPIVLEGSLPLGFNENSAPGELRLRASRIAFRENPFPGATTGRLYGEAALDLRLTGSALRPLLQGEVVITDALAALPAEFARTAGAGTLPVDPRLDLTVHLRNNVRLANSQLDARTEGDIRLTGSLSDPTLFGRLALNEGRLILPTTRFLIQPPGALTLAYPTYEPGPQGRPVPTMGVSVDLRAQTRVTAPSIYGTVKNYRVTVSARGPLTGGATDPVTGRPRLTLIFTTDPPDLAGSQEALARRLAGIWIGESAIGQIGVNPTQAIATQLTNVFTGSVLPGLFDRPAAALGFEQLSFTYDPVQRITINISRQLFGPFYAFYARSLSSEDEIFTFRLSARFRERLQASWEVNERNEQRILLEGIWRF